MPDFYGTVGPDVLNGTEDADYIYDPEGNDTINAGGGDDIIRDDGGNDTIDAGAGNDTIYLIRPDNYMMTTDTVTIRGAGGDDTVIASLAYQTTLLGDLGSGNDTLRLDGGVYFNLRLGTGRDTIHLNSPQFDEGGRRIRDFEVGDAGDVFNFSDALQAYTDGVSNPFASGHLILAQVGDDAILYFDTGGGGSTHQVVLALSGIDASTLTAANFFGFDPNGGAIAAGQIINGTSVGETIDGTAGADTIDGGDGDDTIYGYYSADVLAGGLGHDAIYGGAGEDQIDGGDGNDRLDGGGHYDTILGGAGNDVISGGDWHADHLDGGEGNDTLVETGGDDTMLGGDGDDTILHQSRGAPTIDGGLGNDDIEIDHGTSRYGSSGEMYSFDILAGEGNDTVRYGSEHLGHVIIDLGGGNDTLDLDSGFQTFAVVLGAGSDRFTIGNLQEFGRETIVLVDFEAGDDGDIFDILSSLNRWASGSSTWDGESNPFATGHVVLVQQDADLLVQFDRDGSAVSDFDPFTVAVLENVSLSDLTAFNFDGAPPDGSPIVGLNLVGTANADNLVGTIRPDTLTGLAGDDFIDGRAGDDVLNGGDGHDTIIGGAGFDQISGGDGDDTITDNGRVQIYGDGGNDTISVTGYGLNYGLINGGDGNDVINAMMFTNLVAHTDSIAAGAGNDVVTYEGGAAGGVYHVARIHLGSGDDVLYLGPSGSFSDPTITTGSGTDYIHVTGSYGIDGGPTSQTNPISIVVTDFTTGETGDVFDFSQYVLSQAQNLIGTNPFAGGFWARLVQNGADTILQFSAFATSDRWIDLAIFQNTQADQFVDYNLGYDIDAPSPGGLTLVAESGGSNLVGTFLRDYFYGSDDSDTIEGRGGNDRVYAGGGDDWIYTSRGYDYIDAGAGDDYIESGAGRDRIFAGDGNDYIVVTHLTGRIDGGAGYDVIDFRDQFYQAYGALDWDYQTFSQTGSFSMGRYQVTNIEQVDFLDGTRGHDRIVYGPDYGFNVAHNGRGGIDHIEGGKLDDWLSGDAGSDRLYGHDGDDELVGGSGRDLLEGGAGNDTLRGGHDADRLLGGDGDDTLIGYIGDDTLRGDDGDDYLDGGTGTDILGGGNGNDTLTLDLSDGDLIDGGNGFDRLLIDYSPTSTPLFVDFSAAWSGGLGVISGGTFSVARIESIEAYLGKGDDTLIVGDGFLFAVDLEGGLGNDTLGGSGVGDVLRGDQGDDTIYGYGGDDQIWGDHSYLTPDGNDLLRGGHGDDAIYGQGGDDELYGDEGDDFVSGGAGNDRIFGGAGSDVLVGLEGDDVISGGSGQNSISAGSGNDVVEFGNSYSNELSIEGGSGYDTLRATQDDTLVVWTGSNISGFEAIDASQVNSLTFVGSAQGDSLNIGSLTEGLSGTLALQGTIIFDGLEGNDSILGIDGSQELHGGAGDDILNGGAGADRMVGGTGDDRFFVDDIGDEVIESLGEGHDEVYASIDYTLSSNVEDLRLEIGAIEGTGNSLANRIDGNDADNIIRGAGGADIIHGGAGDDDLFGDEGDDDVFGGFGNDEIWGGLGSDLLFGDDGQDTIHGGADNDGLDGGFGDDNLFGDGGNDVLIGGDGNDDLDGGDGEDILSGGFDSDTISGGAGNDQLFGDEGDDILSGGDGDDDIIGGDGLDIMTGGNGADFFIALGGESVPGLTADTADRITDFDRSEGDKIDLQGIDANFLVDGDQAFQWLGTGAFSGAAGQLRYEQNGGNTMIYGDVDGDGVADFAIRLDGLVDLASTDFVL